MNGIQCLSAMCVLTATGLWLGGCGDGGATSKIAIDGSSTVYPITQAVAEEYRKTNKETRIPVGISGTGGGFKKFIAGKTDISDASRPIKKKELDAAKEAGIDFIEIPVAYDGLSIVVNKENTWVETLTVGDLKKIFLASDTTAKTWKDVNDAFPAEPIKLYIPGTDSGTFDYFKEVVAGKTGSIREDVTANEDDNILVKGVAGSKGGIGFFGCAYYFQNKAQLKVVKIDPGTGTGIEPTAKTIEDGSYKPFSRPLLIYVSAKAADRPEVKSFINYYLTKGLDLVADVGYVKLPSSVYEAAKKNFAEKKTGTHFLDDKGEKVKGSLTEVYK